MSEPLMSPTGEWLIVKPKLEKRIEDLRDHLEEGRGEPAEIRGEIRGLRWLVEQVEIRAPLVEETNYQRSTDKPA